MYGVGLHFVIHVAWLQLRGLQRLALPREHKDALKTVKVSPEGHNTLEKAGYM